MVKVFSVYDAKANCYMQPFFALTKGLGTRVFAEWADDENHPCGKWPDDFTLFEIGEWDDQQGVLINHAANISLGTALEYKNKEKV